MQGRSVLAAHLVPVPTLLERCPLHREGATLMGQNDDWDEPEVQVFYADPVDADGNVIGTVNLDSAKVHCSWTDSVRVTKVPASEIVLDPETTIYAKVPERKDDDAKS